ncbi:MAG: aminotransferase [Sulfurospirillum sp.]|nr:MAG: aminotransferase [Sulfurospirillum sp.]
MRGEKIRLSKSAVSEEEKAAVLSVLDKEFLGMGEEVMFFEDEIKRYLETEFDVVCVNTGTSALHLALEALDIKAGDEVLVPSLTYVATFQAISACGATPVAVEVNPDTLFIDMQDAQKRLSENTRAIMPVHYASSAKGIEEVYAFAQKHSLRVIEDAAQAFGSQRGGKKVGTEGDIICFSFDGIKNITSGEGGAIVSGDKRVIQRVQDGRLLGVEKDTQKRYAGQRSWDFDVTHQGFRYHMSNIMAAIGRAQLKKIDAFKRKRQAIVDRYIEALKDMEEVGILDFDYEDIVPHIFVIKVQQRDALREYLIGNNIECGVHYKPNHLLHKYRTPYSLPVTEKIYEEILTLPCHYDLTEEEQRRVIKSIKDFYSA